MGAILCTLAIGIATALPANATADDAPPVRTAQNPNFAEGLIQMWQESRQPPTRQHPTDSTPPPPASRSVLTDQEWQQIAAASDRAVNWLARQQAHDGSFPTRLHGQPGVTSLCVLAFMAHGHMPGEGRHGESVSRALEFIVRQQRPDGLVASVGPPVDYRSRQAKGDVGSTAAYNHAISGLALSEAYGVSSLPRHEDAIRRALEVTLEMQRWFKSRNDFGGWRYVHKHDNWDSDLSVTGWQLMFLRSAKNAGFEVQQQPIDDAVGYVIRCFDQGYGTFEYEVSNRDRRSRGMAGAGILALAHAGMHNSREAQASGDWILRHPFDDYNHFIQFSDQNRHKDRYHYGLFNCAQAMYQLGGRHWEGFYPSAMQELMRHQQRDGAWPIDANNLDGVYGPTYSTSLALLALAAPNQLLPIFQR